MNKKLIFLAIVAVVLGVVVFFLNRYSADKQPLQFDGSVVGFDDLNSLRQQANFSFGNHSEGKSIEKNGLPIEISPLIMNGHFDLEVRETVFEGGRGGFLIDYSIERRLGEVEAFAVAAIRSQGWALLNTLLLPGASVLEAQDEFYQATFESVGTRKNSVKVIISVVNR